MSLKQKTMSALFWSFFSQGGKQASQLIVTAILAKILSPSDFGTLAMVTVFSNFAMIFSELGITSALIQKQDATDRHYYSAFWLNIVIGAVLTLSFMAMSPVIAWFYKKPELIPLLVVVSLNFVFSSFTIIQNTVLTKAMNFKSLAIRDIVAVSLSGMLGIVLAYYGFGVWSLVFQMLGFTVLSAVLLWFFSSWRPRFQFASSDIRDIFNFSANLTGFNILNYFARNVDQLLIGKCLGAQSLGYYSLAYKIMLYPLQNISWVIVKVMFPAFSRIQHDLGKVREGYMKMVRVIALITFPLMIGLLVLAPDVVQLLLGSKWLDVVGIVRVFCLCGLIQSILTTTGSLLQSQGRADLQFRLGIVNSFFSVLSVLIGLRWGIMGVAICYTIEQYIWACYAQPLTNSIIQLRFNVFIVPLMKIFVTAGVMGVVLFALKISILPDVDLMSLMIKVFLGLVVYCLISYPLNTDLLKLFFHKTK